MSLFSIETLFREPIKANIIKVGIKIQTTILQTKTKLDVSILLVHKKNPYAMNSMDMTIKLQREKAPIISALDN